MLKEFKFDLSMFDEPPVITTTPPAVTTGPVTLSDEDLIKDPRVQAQLAKVRQEEKDKLYSRITALDGDVKSLKEIQARAERDKAELAERARQDAMAAMSAEERLKVIRTEAEESINNIKNSVQAELTLSRQEAAQAKLDLIRTQAIHASGIPEGFAKFVNGNTKEEIEHNIELVKASIEEVKKTLPPVITPPLQYPPTNSGVLDPSKGGRTGLDTQQDIIKTAQADYTGQRDNLLASAKKLFLADNQQPSS